MSDKSHSTPDGRFALSNHRLMALSGRDALAFAQAQFMNDVARLGDVQWQWNGWLTPKGRVIALFALLRVDGETLWLLLPDADPHPLAEALKRFVFRSKVAIAVRDDLHVAGRFGAPLAASGALASGLPGASAQAPVADEASDSSQYVELDMSGDGGPRALYVSASPGVPSPALEAEWAAADLRHGLPRLPASQIEHWTPQQLSLERLQGFSVKKGCYPGQEIVARTHFLGKVKRGLMLVSSEAPLEVGAELNSEESILGTLVSTAHDQVRHYGVAVVPLDRDLTARLTVHGQTAVEESLLAGLSR